jgi:Tfp pilus assembly protein PilF
MLNERGALGEQKLFLPIFNGEYSLFSLSHFLDHLNLWLLAAPVVLFILISVCFNKSIIKEKLLPFLLSVLFPFFIFFFFMDPKIELLRDWDLFSIVPAISSIIAVTIVMSIHSSSIRKTFKVLVLVFTILSGGTLILLNHSEEASANRFYHHVLNSERKLSSTLLAHNYEQLADYYKANNKKELEKHFRILTAKADSTNPRHFNNLATIFYAERNFPEALNYYQQALKLKPDLFEALLNQGLIYYLTRKFDSASIAFEKAVCVNPIDISVRGYLADTYFTMNKFEESCHQLDTIMHVDTNNIKACKLYDAIREKRDIQRPEKY